MKGEIMSLLGKVVVKLMPKKLLNKVMGRAFKKAPKKDCGIFAQAAKQKERQVMKNFIDQAQLSHIEYSLADLNAKRGVTTLIPYKGGSKTAGLLRDKFHQNAEFGENISKDLLG